MLEPVEERPQSTTRADKVMLVANELLAVHPWMTPWELRSALRDRGLHAEPGQLEIAIARARRDLLSSQSRNGRAASGDGRKPRWKLFG